MKDALSCKFNIDTGCVELRPTDGMQIYLIPNARHMAMVDQPDLFYKALFDIYDKEKMMELDVKA